MPGLNELLDARGKVSRRSKNGRQWNAYDELKGEWQGRIATAFAVQKPLFHPGPCYFAYVIREPNRRRDKSNVIAGAVKLIEDTLKTMGIIHNDGWSDVMSIEPHVDLATPECPPGVTVFLRSEYRLPVEVELTGEVQDRIRYFEGNAYETSGIRIGGGRAKENRPPARKTSISRRAAKNR